ncbi:hypothetical protein BDV96DRAFT_639093 [Lophiotrema nucula]|uniref:Uncharacterized protein n=1 Tax=Lophiotrema nucula TaxID=690887 RepID=A0A6A5ZW67_9PLEO|nr:hypothetical protein BDV96DRAFT_639093 [Lophiotrema nucula]
MKLTPSHLVLASTSGTTSASAIPTQADSLENRSLKARIGSGTLEDPTWIDIDCTGGVAVCNADCLAILCFGAPNPVQLDSGHSADKRKESRFSSGLLRTQEETRQGKGIYIPQHVLESTGYSLEETVMANAVEGGWGEIIVPVNGDENRLIGARTRAAWVQAHIGFDISHTLLTHVSIRPDHKVCTKKNKADTDPIRLAFVRTAENNANGQPYFHMMDVDAGDRWHRFPWGSLATTMLWAPLSV